MVSQRLLNAPRSFRHDVAGARASCGFRLDFNSTTDAAGSQPKFFLNISDVSAGRVMFTFQNTDPEDYSITHVYFDDGEVMAINALMQPANDTEASLPDRKVAIAGSRHRHENLAIIFDLRAGIGMADIVCALKEERLKVSLKAARPGSDAVEIFINEPLLTLGCPSMLG